MAITLYSPPLFSLYFTHLYSLSLEDYSRTDPSMLAPVTFFILPRFFRTLSATLTIIASSFLCSGMYGFGAL